MKCHTLLIKCDDRHWLNSIFKELYGLTKEKNQLMPYISEVMLSFLDTLTSLAFDMKFSSSSIL